MAVRAHARNLVIIGAAACAIAVAGCGTQLAPGSGSAGSGGAGGSKPAPAKATLTFTIIGSGPVKHWTLRCDPPGGTHPDPAATCRTLMRVKNPFAPPAKHIMCPMIMVSDKQIKVTGTWFGSKVNRVLVDGGCDLTIFNKLNPVIH
jgi:hypothetical protein